MPSFPPELVNIDYFFFPENTIKFILSCSLRGLKSEVGNVWPAGWNWLAELLDPACGAGGLFLCQCQAVRSCAASSCACTAAISSCHPSSGPREAGWFLQCSCTSATATFPNSPLLGCSMGEASSQQGAAPGFGCLQTASGLPLFSPSLCCMDMVSSQWGAVPESGKFCYARAITNIEKSGSSDAESGLD